MLSLVHTRGSRDEVAGVREEDLLRPQVRVNSVRQEPLRRQLSRALPPEKYRQAAKRRQSVEIEIVWPSLSAFACL